MRSAQQGETALLHRLRATLCARLRDFPRRNRLRPSGRKGVPDGDVCEGREFLASVIGAPAVDPSVQIIGLRLRVVTKRSAGRRPSGPVARDARTIQERLAGGRFYSPGFLPED